MNPRQSSAQTRETSDRVVPSLWQLCRAFFLIGLTAYSMAMLQQLKALLIGRRWLTQRELDEGLAMVQLYPGPILFNLAAYSAYRIKGFVGAFLATFLFVLPSYLLMLLLSWLYFRYGQIGWVHPLFIVLEAMVVGIVLHVTIDFSGRYISGGKTALIAGIAFVLMLYRVNAFWIILIAMLLGLLLLEMPKPKENAVKETGATPIPLPGRWQWRMAGLLLAGALFVLLLAVGSLWHSKSGRLLFSMFKVGAVAFGNGMTIMPLLQQEAVVAHHWLTMKEFADGIAFGQITPGPFLITATFIGYKVSSLLGSALATVGMFYPSFFYTLVITELYEKIKDYGPIRKALKGILAAFTGMLVFVLLSLGKVSLVAPATYIWAAGALIAVRYWKINILWIFLAGIAAELLLYFAGMPLFNLH
ncbi:chromate efflux transporter [Nitratifractor salsuginis]|uniref:Chromate transporter, chromate ion transporter (CHR) family n=1 Tax=Nitratifractor salsuginis (strain DSM 16511 / JCM 12458 / E9I37-1) TaxID=749222 RepID=E6X120_NITSE|nr:chromate efflux transporter [Nitratifractor salsuginis]ADV45823.1 chromate transporter, chromate ion transporter (CHR) family [Nitratifractor salsuginis DSM 16511]